MITITGFPLFDGMIEGFLAIPLWLASVISPADIYAFGFWFGVIIFISGSGDKRGHGKTPLFMAGMKCLPLCKVQLLSAANNCLRPMQRYIN